MATPQANAGSGGLACRGGAALEALGALPPGPGAVPPPSGEGQKALPQVKGLLVLELTMALRRSPHSSPRTWARSRAAPSLPEKVREKLAQAGASTRTATETMELREQRGWRAHRVAHQVCKLMLSRGLSGSTTHCSL